MRLFLAVDPDAAARSMLGDLTGTLQHAVEESRSAFRWAMSDNIHLTLHFLGEVDESKVDALRRALGATLDEPAFDIELAELGVFPRGGPPKVLWIAPGTGRESVARIHQELARRLIAVGLTPEDRDLTPHLTLARARDRRPHGRTVAAQLAAARVPPIRWRVNEVTLYRSDLSGPAPRYDAIHRIALQRT